MEDVDELLEELLELDDVVLDAFDMLIFLLEAGELAHDELAEELSVFFWFSSESLELSRLLLVAAIKSAISLLTLMWLSIIARSGSMLILMSLGLPCVPVVVATGGMLAIADCWFLFSVFNSMNIFSRVLFCDKCGRFQPLI